MFCAEQFPTAYDAISCFAMSLPRNKRQEHRRGCRETSSVVNHRDMRPPAHRRAIAILAFRYATVIHMNGCKSVCIVPPVLAWEDLPCLQKRRGISHRLGGGKSVAVPTRRARLPTLWWKMPTVSAAREQCLATPGALLPPPMYVCFDLSVDSG